MANFFDRVVYEVNKGVSSVSESSKSLIEKSKLSVAVSDCEAKKLKIAQEIGIKVYNLYMEGKAVPEEITDECNQITAIIEEIKENKKRIEELKSKSATFDMQKKVCKCGFENTADSAFCSNCGEKLN